MVFQFCVTSPAEFSDRYKSVSIFGALFVLWNFVSVNGVRILYGDFIGL